jgi:hypothetical protein
VVQPTSGVAGIGIDCWLVQVCAALSEGCMYADGGTDRGHQSGCLTYSEAWIFAIEIEIAIQIEVETEID